MSFRKGPEVNPFAGASREPMRLLEAMTAVEIASCVPRIVITKIDTKTGKPMLDVRPLMYDLLETPDFSNAKFGDDSESMLERVAVSLDSMTVATTLLMGQYTSKIVTLAFTVHRPSVVFDRNSDVSWKQILEEGKSFSLQYGWVADPTIVKNDLFNGIGHVTDAGLVIKSTQTMLLIVTGYSIDLKADGTVAVTITAHENGDIAFRELRVDATPEQLVQFIDALPRIPHKEQGFLIKLEHVFDRIISPMIIKACEQFGYDAAPEMFLANFNLKAGTQSPRYGGLDMSTKSIGDMLFPLKEFKDQLTKSLTIGKAMSLRSFIDTVINMASSVNGWGQSKDNERQKPNIVMKTDTISTREGGTKLIVNVYDRVGSTDVFRDAERLPLERQSRADVMKVLEDRDVPVLEFARAGSMILDASFQIQVDELTKSIQVETADAGRKSKVQVSQMTDAESREGQARPGDIIPVSILSGEVTMYGNFVLETFGLIWIDFFGSSAISGIFHAMEKTDSIEAGKFTSTVKLFSEGMDPLNTRQKKSAEELAPIPIAPPPVKKKKKR